MADRTLGIYIHIPFCASRCAYCDFCSTADRRDLIPAYQQALTQHMREAAPLAEGYLVDTVYFGGGTPTWYGAERLADLFGEIKERYKVLTDGEVTFEANPDSVTEKGLRALRKAGFNRISLGAQSANDGILRDLGRRHDWAQVVNAVDLAWKTGFENISLDLIYGLPGQSREDWADTLRKAMELQPKHISCYGLKVEEGTPLWSRREDPDLPDEDTQADLYLYAVDTLAAAGYVQYEISNFAKSGYASRHNLKYWMGEEYLGFGASAASWLGGKRFTVLPDAERYIAAIGSGGELMSELEEISLYEQASEYVMLRMRTARGMDPKEYETRYQNSFEPLEKLMESYVRLGLVQRVGDRWRFTPRGFLLSNRLIGELLDAQAEQKYHMGIPWRKEDYYDTLF